MPDKPYHHGDLRNSLLQAATETLRSHPPQDLSLRQLARDTGVSANAPYRHFKDRESLVTALAINGFQELSAAIREGEGTLARLYHHFALQHVSRYRLMFAAASQASPPAELTEAIEGLFAEIMSKLEVDSRENDPEESLRTAVACWYALHGSVMLTLDHAVDWLDSWLRPTPDDVVTGLRLGLHARASRRSPR